MSTRTLARSKYESAYRRWAGIGPYYAMFPIAFAERVIRQYTDVGDVILDPFSGRGTAVFAAAALDRAGIGIEINPVGYVYTKAKLNPANRQAVERRIIELDKNAWRYRQAAEALPVFFQRCYSQRTREFLLVARSWLD
jgi:DNA modification methylase